jgi:hypothetical protein
MVKTILNTKAMKKDRSMNAFDKNTSMGRVAFDKNTSMGRLTVDEAGTDQDNADTAEGFIDPQAADEENQAPGS